MKKTEEELYNELKSYEALIEEYESRLYGGYPEEYKLKIKDQVEILKSQVTIVERDLTRVVERPITKAKKEALLTNIINIKSAIQPQGKGYSVSRKQGMILHNYLYGRIKYDINNAFNSGEIYLNEPDYTYDLNENVDFKSLQYLLQNKYDELLVGEFNYLSLKAFVKNMNDEIRDLSMKDDGF